MTQVDGCFIAGLVLACWLLSGNLQRRKSPGDRFIARKWLFKAVMTAWSTLLAWLLCLSRAPGWLLGDVLWFSAPPLIVLAFLDFVRRS